MKFNFIESYEDISSFIDGPYNEPENEDEFDVEYETVRKALSLKIDQFVTNNNRSSNEIRIGPRMGVSRGIGLIVEESIGSEVVNLVGDLKGCLEDLKIDYVFPINMVLDEENDFKDLYIAVTSEKVLVHADEKDWFSEIGVNC